MNETEAKLPVAVVGAGRMGRHHTRTWASLPEAELLAVVDPDAERAATVAEEYGGQALSSIPELLERFPQVRAVSIATPTASDSGTRLTSGCASPNSET